MPNDNTAGYEPSHKRIFTGRRALLVEDEGAVALLLEDMLVDLGITVQASASNVAQAIEAVNREPVDFVLLDVNLGGNSSYPVARLLSERKIPFLFSTGYGAQALSPEFAEAPTIAKPFSIEHLADKIASTLKQT
jgi:CheY-like chemotaxis protein